MKGNTKNAGLGNTAAIPDNVLTGKKAVIFDMDGTITDTLDAWSNIDKKFLGKRGIAVPDDYINAIATMSFMECAVYTIDRFNLKEDPRQILLEWTELADLEYENNTRLFPYVEDYIKQLEAKGVKLALATSAIKRFYEKALKSTGLYDYFDVFCSVDEVKRSKSHSDIYYLAMEKLGVFPAECVIFEDVEEAALSAAKTGATVYMVHSGKKESFGGITVIDSFKEAPVIYAFTP